VPLSPFQTKFADLKGWLPDGSVGAEEPYEPTELPER
jgi:hypothetical protein